MDAAVLAVSPFITLLAWSVVLLLVHIGLQSIPATLELGSSWNAGARDESTQRFLRAGFDHSTADIEQWPLC